MQLTTTTTTIIIINKIYFTREIILHVAQTVNTEQLQNCVPKKHGLFRCIMVNTKHKGVNKDDDDDDDDNNNNEIQRMWKVKTSVIPVIIGETGTISKSFRKCISNIPGNHEVKELQKTAILDSAHIIRKVLT